MTVYKPTRKMLLYALINRAHLNLTNKYNQPQTEVYKAHAFRYFVVIFKCQMLQFGVFLRNIINTSDAECVAVNVYIASYVYNISAWEWLLLGCFTQSKHTRG